VPNFVLAKLVQKILDKITDYSTGLEKR